MSSQAGAFGAVASNGSPSASETSEQAGARIGHYRTPGTAIGYEVIPIDRYRELGPERCIAIIDERVGDSPLYVTFDLDGLIADRSAAS
jgi:arginase family enzyme